MTKLSLEKFVEVAKQNNFKIESIFSLHGIITFFEMKTPNTCKTFFVHVPDKYVISSSPSSSTSISNLPVKYDMEKVVLDTTKQDDVYTRYVSQTLVDDYDLISITSTGLCHIRSLKDTQMDLYSFKLGEYRNDDEGDAKSITSSRPPSSSTKSEDNDPLLQTIKQNDITIENLIKDSNIETESVHTPKADIMSDATGQASPSSSDKDEFIPHISSSSSSSTSSSEHSDASPQTQTVIITPLKRKKKKKALRDGIKLRGYSPPPVKNPDDTDIIIPDTSVVDIPQHLEDKQITLGILYFCCELPKFVSDILTIETQVERCWKLIEEARRAKWDNEMSVLSDKFKKLNDIITKKITKLVEKYNLTQTQLAKLCVVYIKSSQKQGEEHVQFQQRARTAIEGIYPSLIYIRNNIENEFEKIDNLIEELQH